MNRRILLLIGITAGLTTAVQSFAIETGALGGTGSRQIAVRGRKEITVTTPRIQLGDVAEVTGAASSDDETVIGLKKIFISESPRPGQETTLSASQVLERMREEGVNLQRVGYSFPRVVTVKRASRMLTIQEVERTIENYLKDAGSTASVKNISYRGDMKISPGEAEIEAIPFTTRDPSQLGFDMRIKVNDAEETRLNVTTAIEDWREVPVAARNLNKGSVVGPEDVRMARLNLKALPGDIVVDDKNVIGKETGIEVSQGGFFKQAKLTMPTIITAGEAVTIRYRIKSLEATATGVALDPGGKGQDIRVKNAFSKKVLTGSIVEPGLVEVRAQSGTTVIKQE